MTTATTDDVRAAHAAGIDLHFSAEPDECDVNGWRLQVRFEKNREPFVFSGRMFRAPSKDVAHRRASHQLKRLLGVPSHFAERFSSEFIAARTALEVKIKQVWEQGPQTASDMIKPGLIKVDWNRREPSLKVMRFTSFDALRRRYDPELARFTEVSKQELIHPV